MAQADSPRLARHRCTVLAIAAIVTGAAAAPASMPPHAAQQIAAAKANARYLAGLWRASHPGRAAPDAVNPAIISGRIVGATVNVQVPPAAPAISFKFKTGSAGFSSAYFEFYNAMTNQNFTINVSSSTAPVSGSFTAQNPGSVNQYAAPGTYTMQYAGIGDAAGNFTSYTNTQLASIFPSLDVQVTNNGMADTTLPVLISGKLKTKTVSLSSSRPYFLANVQVSDTISGVQEVFIVVADPSGTTYTTATTASSPVINAASVPVGFDLSPYGNALPTGTWTINEVFVQDVAGNSVEIGGAPDIQKIFGTNIFQVTQ